MSQSEITVQNLSIDRPDPDDASEKELIDATELMGNLIVKKYSFSGADGSATLGTIPIGSLVMYATLNVSEAFVGGTSIKIGDTDDDGYLQSILTADLTVKATLSTGAYIGKLVVAGADSVDLVVTGTYTAGEAVLTVVYLDPR